MFLSDSLLLILALNNFLISSPDITVFTDLVKYTFLLWFLSKVVFLMLSILIVSFRSTMSFYKFMTCSSDNLSLTSKSVISYWKGRTAFAMVAPRFLTLSSNSSCSFSLYYYFSSSLINILSASSNYILLRSISWIN